MAEEKTIKQRKEELELRLMEKQLAEMEAKEAAKAAGLDSQRRTLAENARLEKQRQENCNHRKGGIGFDDFRNGRGNMNEFSVNNHTSPAGDVIRLCLRCSKEWHPPNCKCTLGGCKKRCTPQEYAEAMRWPTDNVGSSSVTFEHTLEAV